MAEHWNPDSGIKWQLSEQALEKAFQLRRLDYTRQCPTGVNHSNVDFISSIAFFEQKNWYEPINSQFVLDNVVPKFMNLITEEKPMILVCSRIYQPAKNECKEHNIIVWEFGKQLVTKEIWKNYPNEKRKYSTFDIWEFIHFIHEKLNELLGEGSKVIDRSLTTITTGLAIERRIQMLRDGTLFVTNDRGHFLLAMINNEIDPQAPFMLELKICEHCGTLYQAEYAERKFCSMRCFNAWRRGI